MNLNSGFPLSAVVVTVCVYMWTLVWLLVSSQPAASSLGDESRVCKYINMHKNYHFVCILSHFTVLNLFYSSIFFRLWNMFALLVLRWPLSVQVSSMVALWQSRPDTGTFGSPGNAWMTSSSSGSSHPQQSQGDGDRRCVQIGSHPGGLWENQEPHSGQWDRYAAQYPTVLQDIRWCCCVQRAYGGPVLVGPYSSWVSLFCPSCSPSNSLYSMYVSGWPSSGCCQRQAAFCFLIHRQSVSHKEDNLDLVVKKNTCVLTLNRTAQVV